MAMLFLGLRSLWNRGTATVLTVSAIAVSVALLLGVQMLKTSAQESFFNTLSGTDLIVGSRTGAVNLLLYSVFRIGDATDEVSWTTYQKIAHHPDVAWTIPLSLGDSHRGFRVLGTDLNYFLHYRFAGTHALKFAEGGVFRDLYDAVLGADVAGDLKYKIGDRIVVSHGLGGVSFIKHGDKPFRVCGILERTGTPVDRTVHVSLEGISAMHIDWQSGFQAPPGERVSAQEARSRNLTPDGVSAFLVSMRSEVMTLTMQRAINTYRAEPLLAILPGVTIGQLWELIGAANVALSVVAAFVVLAGLLGMSTAILSSLNERRREMAIFRSVGARPAHILGLMLVESALLTLGGVTLGVVLTYLLILAGRPLLQGHLGLYIAVRPPSIDEMSILAAILVAALVMAFLPAVRAYRNTLSDGLQIRM